MKQVPGITYSHKQKELPLSLDCNFRSLWTSHVAMSIIAHFLGDLCVLQVGLSDVMHHPQVILQVNPVRQHLLAYWAGQLLGRSVLGAVMPVRGARIEEDLATFEALALAARQLDDALKPLGTEL